MNQELNRFMDLLLLLEISDLINILLIIITIGTVRYASKTLLMEYSSQIIISRYRIRSQNKEGESYTWEVDIEEILSKNALSRAYFLCCWIRYT